MAFSLPHVVVTAAIVFVTVFLLERLSFVKEASRAKRALIAGGVVFVVMTIVNLFWPAGGTGA